MASSESDEIRDMYCEPCYKDGIKDTKASGFCSSCVEYLCNTCVRYHKKHCPNHELKDEDEMPTDYCFDLCSSHVTELIKFYCKICDTTACAQCKENEHANCTDIHHLPDICAEFEKSAELHGLEDKIMKIRRNIRSFKKVIVKGEKRTENLKSAASNAIKRQRDKMISQFDHFEDRMNNIASKIHDKDKAKIHRQENEAVAMEKELISMETDLRNMKIAQQRCKLFIKTKKVDKDIDIMEEKLGNLECEFAVQDYSYEPFGNGVERPLGSIRTENNGKLTNDMEALMADLNIPIRIACQSIQESLKAYFLPFVVMLLVMFDIKVNWLYRLLLLLIIMFVQLSPFKLDSFIFCWVSVYLKGFLSRCIVVTSWIYTRLGFENVKHWPIFFSLQEWYKQIPSSYIKVKTEKNSGICNITGICFLSPVHLAIVDNNNSSVKIIDIDQESVITELLIGGKLPFKHPWDVTKVGNDQLAITLPRSETICFLQLTCCFGLELISLSITRTLPVHCHCYGIVYFNSKLIVSCTGNGPSVKALDLDGNVLQSFSKDCNGENMFTLPYYIITSQSDTCMYVSDFYNQVVTRLSMDGTVLSSYRHKQLRETFGIATDKEDNVYVCGINNIFKLSKTLAKGEEVLHVDRVSNAIAFCEKTNTFWVGFHHADEIKRFKLAA